MPEPSPPIIVGRSHRVDDHDYPMAGETLGLWRLVGGLGRGGMGEVYEGVYDYLHLLTLRYGPEQREIIRLELESLSRDEQARLASDMLGTPLPPDARFAIKVCNARSGTPGHRRFLQEAEVAQRLGDHPYIVTVHALNGGIDETSGFARRLELDRGKYRDVAFMVMDLATRSYDHARLTIGEAVHIVRCIATALDHAHSKGIVHRDLKPENLLGSVEHPLLTDFGIAKEIDASEGLTRTGQIIGTLDYMSPEQATDAKRVDHRSDIYSLGVVLYEFATQGGLPYSHKLDRDSCLTAIRSERHLPKWPREHRADFPVGLERIILKCMAHRMEDRYQAMSELINDLDRFTRGDWITLWGRIPIRNWVGFQVRYHPRMLWGSVAAAVVLIAVLGAIYLLPLTDLTRRAHTRDLNALAAQVDEIAGRGAKTQLSKDETEKLEDIRKNLRYAQGSYPDLVKRLETIERTLLGSRRLVARFTQPRGEPRAQAAVQAKQELQLAVRSDSPKWFTADDGLVMGDFQQIPLRPYGVGLVYVSCRLILPSAAGFRIEVSEAGDVFHRSTWRIVGEELQFTLTEDERPPVVLRREKLAGNRLNLAMEIGPTVRTWVAGLPPVRHPLRGLRDGAPAQIELDLPKDTVLEALEIWPWGPP